MKIGHLNVRSLISSFNNFIELIEDQHFDVIGITETWLNDDILTDRVNIPGYRLFRKDREGRGGGVALYVSDKLSCQEISFDFQFTTENIWMKLRVSEKLFIIGVLYRPPSKHINNFIEDLDNMLSFVTPTFDEVILLGDFNINFFNVDNVATNCCNSYNLTQIINEATRISSNTLLDPIFVSDNDMLLNSGVLAVDNISDHNLVFCTIKHKKTKFKQKFVTYRNFKNFNLNQFQLDLDNLPWHELISANDVNKKIFIFNNFIINLFNEHAPLKTVRVSKPKAPWLTENIKLIMKERDLALNKFKINRTPENWEQYKQLRNFALSSVRNEKKAYLTAIQSENDSWKTWQTIRSLNIYGKTKNKISDNFNCNDINSFFCLPQNSNNSCTEQINFYNSNIYNNQNNFNFQFTTIEEVHNILFNLKSNACGADSISLHMLRYCSPVIDKYMVHIFNYSIETGTYPNAWKEAIGIALPKTTNPESLSDLRIICLLPVISKIFEKVLATQISQYMNDNNLISKFQMGFRKHCSTTTVLSNVTDDIIRAWDRKMLTILVLLDFSKAFDTINHDLLCSKLKYYGFNDLAVELVTSYLKERKRRVVVDGETSETKLILDGVPQGSILGPLLFIIYTSDILNSVKTCQIQAYADDTQIYFSYQPEEYANAQSTVNNELNNIFKIATEHNLKLNTNKSVCMMFGQMNKVRYAKSSIKIKINDDILPFQENCKNLGLFLDNNLRFKLHVQKLLQKSYSTLKILYSNRHVLNFKLKKVLCESLVLSVFNYSDIIYGPCLDLYTKERIQKVQNTCCRLIYGLRKRDHVSYTRKLLGWLNMEGRRDLHFMVFVQKLMTQPTPSILLEKLVTRDKIHDINVRNKLTLTMPQHSTSMFKRSFTFNAIKLYNKVPNSIKSKNIISFKKQCIALIKEN